MRGETGHGQKVEERLEGWQEPKEVDKAEELQANHLAIGSLRQIGDVAYIFRQAGGKPLLLQRFLSICTVKHPVSSNSIDSGTTPC